MLSSTFIDRLFMSLLRISRMNRGSPVRVYRSLLALRMLIVWVVWVFTSSMYSFQT